MITTKRKEVFEILEDFTKAKNKKERVEVLEKNKGVPAFMDVLRGTFDDQIQFLLPEGKPPYTPNKAESTPSTLLREHRQFGVFVKGGKNQNLKQFRIEQLFVNMLESIHPEDSKIVVSMVCKKSPVKNLTKNLVKEVFPELISS